ncbi:MAG: hypothetical protein HY754_05795 [Nitrospirae bacterium]|nr:hypothetical protein [Nitrospirota bacterium]
MLRLFGLTLYSVGMAYIEAMVVVYLRRLIPFTDLSGMTIDSITSFLRENHIYFEEQTREAATIIMLICIALLTGRNVREKIAVFLWCSGIWDIFYYVFLRIWTGWPGSFMDMDVLFLIPAPWVSPVAVPLGISLSMTAIAYFLFRIPIKGRG